MPTNPFHRTLAAAIGVLAIITIVLSALLYASGPRVRIVSFEKDPKNTSLQTNSLITVSFDRPLEDRDYSQAISFTPELTFSTKTTAQSIAITLKQNLQHDQSYTLRIAPDIYDTSGKKMADTYEHHFRSSQPRFAYLERNYNKIDQSAPFTYQDADDHVMLGRYGSEETDIIFSHPQISMFAINDTHAVVATHKDESSQLHIVDLKNRSTRTLQQVFNGAIRDLTMSRQDTTALYTHENKLESLDIASGVSTPILNENGESLIAFSIDVDTYGQTALVQDGNQAFYAVSPFNDFPPILIGSHASTYGFNLTGDKIIFRSNEAFSLYDTATGEVTPRTLDTDAYIQTVRGSDAGYFYSTNSYSIAQTDSSVRRLSSWEDQESKLVWSGENYPDTTLLELMPSYDGQLLALELNPISCRYDRLTSSVCTEPTTIVYDQRQDKESLNFRGFDFVWLP